MNEARAALRTGIPLPPLPEQQRIVGILDEAFEGIATAKANAEKNLQNARALFESHLQSVFTHRGKEWEKQPLIGRLFYRNHLAYAFHKECVFFALPPNSTLRS